ncbi:DUF2125 domain-containing protein [Candidatus Odyssella thessalonicensis]|uniref:DUF2125 domain-containing protein n=1 Tax=Candidatus Odyssella thessalonicensis TaxID=84647 RepID=UPI000225A9C4|nr:DUF2125 domain-containing protein [Candidatus Odyssella thessalonicensis]
MRCLGKIGLIVLSVIICLKVSEQFLFQPYLNDYAESYLRNHSDKVTVDSVKFDKSDLSLTGIKVTGMTDTFSVVGSMQPVLLGWPGVDFMVRPSGSKIWEIAQIQGKAKVGWGQIFADNILIQNLRYFKAPQFVVPEIFISFVYYAANGLIDLKINIPQFGPHTGEGQLSVIGQLDAKNAWSGKLSLRIVNPAAVLHHLAEVELISSHQLSSIKAFMKGIADSKAEITLPLSLEKGALYLGPIRLYPKPSREESLARIGEGVISNLFRTFAKVPQ